MEKGKGFVVSFLLFSVRVRWRLIFVQFKSMTDEKSQNWIRVPTDQCIGKRIHRRFLSKKSWINRNVAIDRFLCTFLSWYNNYYHLQRAKIPSLRYLKHEISSSLCLIHMIAICTQTKRWIWINFNDWGKCRVICVFRTINIS